MHLRPEAPRQVALEVLHRPVQQFRVHLVADAGDDVRGDVAALRDDRRGAA